MANSVVVALIPILFVVVNQLAGVGRELDLQAALSEERNPLGIPILDWIPWVPSLGQFNFIHAANLSILTVSLILAAVLSSGWIKLGLMLSTWFMLVVLPVLEINCYDKIVKLEKAPYTLPKSNLPWYSFHVNLTLSTALTMVVVGFATVHENGQRPFKFIETHPSVLSIIGVIAFAYMIFLKVLEEELRLIVSPFESH
jgi:hypothetical protein